MFTNRKGFSLTMLLIVILLLTSCDTLEIINNAQTLFIDWAYCYGGSAVDALYDITETGDNCYVGVGQSYSDDGDLLGNNGKYDVWVIKFRRNGDLIWSKNYGGTDDETGKAVLPTDDGGCVVAGDTKSNDGDVSTNKGERDFWILRLNRAGNKLWEVSYGGSEKEYAYDICKAADGNYVIAGSTESNNHDVSGFHGIRDYWVIKINALDGSLIWQKTLGGSDSDRGRSICATDDDGFLVAGMSSSNDHDVSANNGQFDVWLVKLDQWGDKVWDKNYGGSENDLANSVAQTSNHGFIVGGRTFSNDIDVSGKHGNEDGWVVRTDGNGDLKWAGCYGGTDYDEIKSILQTQNGGYAMLGYSKSEDNDLSDNHGSYDFWFTILDEVGTVQRSQNYGGTQTEIGSSLIESSNGDFILAGNTYSNDIDVSGNKEFSDYWILSLELK